MAMVGRNSTSHHCHVTSQARIIAAVKNIDQRRTQEFCSEGVQQIQFRTEGRVNGNGSPPSQGFCSICKWVNPVFLLGLLEMYFPQNWEFGSALSKLLNSGGGGGVNPQPPLVRHWYLCANVDACVARTWISYRGVPCHPWCTYRKSLVVKKQFH
jgi:hypothetical protein